MKGFTKSSILLAMVVLASSSTAWAAAPQDNQITVTATRNEQLVKVIPTSTTVITNKEIQERHYNTLEEALLTVPGLQMISDPHGGINVQLRGMEARHTLILINGERTPNVLTKTRANAESFNRINMNNVERIEVITGAASALYGSEAMGGVINIITKDSNTPSGQIGYEYITRDTTDKKGKVYNLSLHSGWQGKVSANLYAERNDFVSSVHNGYTTTFEGPRTPISFDVTYKANDKNSFKVSYSHNKEALRQYGFGGAGADTKKDITTDMYGIQYKGEVGKSKIMTRLYENKYKDYYHSARTVNMGPRGIHTYYNWDKTQRRERVFEVQVNTPVNDNHDVTYGVEIRNTDGIGTRIKTNDKVWTETIDGKTQSAYKAKMNTKSFYVQDFWTINDKVVIIPAVRIDKSDKFSSRVSPKVGITYTPQKDVRVKANFGTGYTMPGYTEMYHSWQMFGPGAMGPGSPGWFFQGNPNLKPETSVDFDISIEKDFKKMTAKATYFQNRIKDYIGFNYVATVPVTNSSPGAMNNVYQYQNTDRAKMSGIELTGTIRLNDAYDLFGTYMYLDAKNADTGARLGSKAKQSFSAGINYHKNSWKASLWGNMLINYTNVLTDRQDNLIGYEYKNYNLWNFSISKAFNKNVEAYFTMENIFKDYQVGRDIDGRQYHFGMNVKF